MTDMENEVMTEAADDIIFPDGWTEDADIFDLGEPLGDNLFPEMAAEEISGADTTPTEEAEAPATEQIADEVEYEATGEAAPATETEAPETPVKKLKFKVKVDHNDVDVELDEADLPDVYERAQATDRYKDRLNRTSRTMDTAGKLAAAMGYDGADEMLQAAADNYRQNLMQELLDNGTPQVIAEDYVNRKMGDLMALLGGQSAEEQTPDPVVEPEPVATTVDGRDFSKEAGELLQVYPELRGHNLPEEVTRDAVTTGKSLLAAYTGYMNKQKTAEIENLRKENKIYKQNAEAASRAPVSGSTGGGATDTKPTDPFLKGFESAW